MAKSVDPTFIGTRDALVQQIQKHHTKEPLYLFFQIRTERMDCSSSDFDYVMEDHYHEVVVLRERKRWAYEETRFTIKAFYQVPKKVYRKLLRKLRLRSQSEYLVSDFLTAFEQRKTPAAEPPRPLPKPWEAFPVLGPHFTKAK